MVGAPRRERRHCHCGYRLATDPNRSDAGWRRAGSCLSHQQPGDAFRRPPRRARADGAGGGTLMPAELTPPPVLAVSLEEVRAYLRIEYAHEDALLASLVRSATGLCEAFRSEEHTSELQSLMRISSAVFCLKKKKNKTK